MALFKVFLSHEIRACDHCELPPCSDQSYMSGRSPGFSVFKPIFFFWNFPFGIWGLTPLFFLGVPIMFSLGNGWGPLFGSCLVFPLGASNFGFLWPAKSPGVWPPKGGPGFFPPKFP